MVVPSTLVVFASIAVLAILLTLGWAIGGMVYNRKPMRLRTEDSPRSGRFSPVKKAA
jgi:hypothetical protein